MSVGTNTLLCYLTPYFLYYNGIPTIKQKAALAKEKASGIMIWQVKGDARGKAPLLRALHEVAKDK